MQLSITLHTQVAAQAKTSHGHLEGQGSDLISLETRESLANLISF
jgi:hypothetical protein